MIVEIWNFCCLKIKQFFDWLNPPPATPQPKIFENKNTPKPTVAARKKTTKRKKRTKKKTDAVAKRSDP